MNEHLLKPLEYYERIGREEHKNNANLRFDELCSESKIDVEANRATVKKYDAESAAATKARARIRKYETLRVLCIIGAVLGAIALFIGAFAEISEGAKLGLLIASPVVLSACILLIFMKLNPLIKSANALFEEHTAKANEHLAEAQRQMASLNSLFDNTETFKLIEKTIPDFSFDYKFTVENHGFFVENHDFLDLRTNQSSVTDTVSGRFAGNPFLFCKTLSQEMGTKTYIGTRVISWTETYRDSDGKMRTRRRTQTLTATVVKPYPEYERKAYLCYGSQAAPDLSFDRTPKHTERLDERDIAKAVKKGEKKLRKKAERAMRKGESFQEMANSEFDVLFGADNRDHEVQFRLMYTPLAQQNTVELITSRTGYGDDFHFNKRHRLNLISSEHSQSFNTDTSGSHYVSYSVDIAREKFVSFNSDYFKSLFFDFAPLFSVPAYLEEPCASLEPPEEYDTNFTSYEHEVMANAIGTSTFAHEASATESILKTSYIGRDGDTDRVAVTAYSFASEPRVDFVSVLGGDGRFHSVPVPWDEYIPIEWTREMLVSAAPVSERETREMSENAQEGIEDAYFHGMWARTC